jgi:hypothetical protein
MKILDQARSAATRCRDAASTKVDGLRAKRQHARLISELGEARYAKSKGVTTSDAEIERIIAEIDALGDPDANTTPQNADDPE